MELIFKDPLIESILESILAKLMQIQKNNKRLMHNKTIKILIDKISEKNMRFFELGILCRKLLELILSDISQLESDKYISVFEYINDLKSKNVADWMITYLHTLRIFGNFAAHERTLNNIPKQMEKTDFIVFTYSINRLLNLHIDFKNQVFD